MKELKIEIPKGYEIDKEQSTFEKIIFKKIKLNFRKLGRNFVNKLLFRENILLLTIVV